MQASIAYLLILLGVGLGIALGGIVGGLMGGVGFFLLHRVYTLSKRLAAIDERLRHLDSALETAPALPEQSPAQTSADGSAPTPAMHAPPQTAISSPACPPLSDPTPTPAPSEPDPLVTLNTTLQALLPALNALNATTSAPTTAPRHVAAAKPTELACEPVIAHVEKNELTEATAAAMAIEHVLLNALRDSSLAAPSRQAPPEKPAPAALHAVSQTTPQTAIETPAPTAHENATRENSPTLNPDNLNQAHLPTPPALSSDLEHLRDELTMLMSDISAERARQTKAATTTPGDEEPADAKTLQELLFELRRLTAKMPPPQH